MPEYNCTNTVKHFITSRFIIHILAQIKFGVHDLPWIHLIKKVCVFVTFLNNFYKKRWIYDSPTGPIKDRKRIYTTEKDRKELSGTDKDFHLPFLHS